MSKFDQFAGKDIQQEPDEPLFKASGADSMADLARQITRFMSEIRRNANQQEANLSRLETMNMRFQRMVSDRQLHMLQVQAQKSTVAHHPVYTEPSTQANQNDNSQQPQIAITSPSQPDNRPTSRAEIAIPTEPQYQRSAWTMGDLIRECWRAEPQSNIIVEDYNENRYMVCEIRNHGDLYTRGQDAIRLDIMRRMPSDVRVRIMHYDRIFERFTLSFSPLNDVVLKIER